jgi:hypothetical protein
VPEFPYIELAPQAFEHPLLFASLLALLTVAAAVGVLRTLRWMWPQGMIVAATLLLPAGLAAGLAKATNQWLFEWYFDLSASRSGRNGGNWCRGEGRWSLQAALAHSRRGGTSSYTQDSPSPFATAFVESQWIQSKRS